ncbi:MAG: tetratricopeptide (TPR) repeat protein [Urechidicola sp.]|jgi:tetratricopeptide (TPR) repeat protein
MHRLITFFLCYLCFNPALAAATIQELQFLVDQNSFSSATVTGTQLLIEQPDNAKIQFLTAYAYQMDNQTNRAKKLYENLIRQHPELPEPMNNLAMIYLNQNNPDKASQLLIDALNTHSSYSTAYTNLGRIYRSIASTTYRQAVSESDQPVEATKIKLAALSNLISAEPLIIVAEPLVIVAEPTVSSVVNTVDVKTLLKELVKNWAKSWNDKDFPTYISFYSANHRPSFKTHIAWVEHRRNRIMRPGAIKVRVSNIEIREQGENKVVINFKQTYDSPNYSDKVLKSLDFRRFGSAWKISEEDVISVL